LLTRTSVSSHEPARTIRQIRGLAEVSDRYDVLFCDIWGVLHNGVSSFSPASEALAFFRQRGGVVILLTNAPRPSAPIRKQVLRLGVLPDAFDAIVTSGDVTIGLIEDRSGDPLLHIGPARDLSLFGAVAGPEGKKPRVVALEGASYVVCTGLRNDEAETPDDYERELQAIASRRLTMICANPDIVIHRGEDLVFCAGALARRYEELGGSVVYAGKPHASIYDRALAVARSIRGAPIEKRRILAIGDGMMTDIAGAATAGLDALLVTQGIHRTRLHRESSMSPADPAELRRLSAEHAVWPFAVISKLEP
jgi:HAD superfamily hydrolase (TIGR01459 family)